VISRYLACTQTNTWLSILVISAHANQEVGFSTTANVRWRRAANSMMGGKAR
jgi:hypothetical protein